MLAQDFMRWLPIDPDAPWAWPRGMRWLACGLTALAAGLLMWWLVFSSVQGEYDKARADHARWRIEFSDKSSRASALPGWQAHHKQTALRLQGLEAQLPHVRDMDAMLSALSRAGQARGLRFELFRPGEVMDQRPYAPQNISVRVAGQYSDLLGFMADVAHLPWLVSMHSFTLRPAVPSVVPVASAVPLSAADSARASPDIAGPRDLSMDLVLRTLHAGETDATLLPAPAPLKAGP